MTNDHNHNLEPSLNLHFNDDGYDTLTEGCCFDPKLHDPNYVPTQAEREEWEQLQRDVTESIRREFTFIEQPPGQQDEGQIAGTADTTMSTQSHGSSSPNSISPTALQPQNTPPWDLVMPDSPCDFGFTFDLSGPDPGYQPEPRASRAGKQEEIGWSFDFGEFGVGDSKGMNNSVKEEEEVGAVFRDGLLSLSEEKHRCDEETLGFAARGGRYHSRPITRFFKSDWTQRFLGAVAGVFTMLVWQWVAHGWRPWFWIRTGEEQEAWCRSSGFERLTT